MFPIDILTISLHSRPNHCVFLLQDDGGLAEGHGGRVLQAENDDIEDAVDAQIEEPFTEEFGLQYTPHVDLPDCAVLDAAHRVHALQLPKKRGRDQKKNVEKFYKNYRAFYDQDLQTSFPARPPRSHGALASWADRIAAQNVLLKQQQRCKRLQEQLQLVEGPELPDDIEFGPSAGPSVPPAIFLPFEQCVMESPADMALRLALETGAAHDQQQYELVILSTTPLHEVWTFAKAAGRLHEFTQTHTRLALIRDSRASPVHVLAHGTGGSGKTYCLTRVILPVYERFCPGQISKQAAQNAAARLIGGATMHAQAALKRGAALTEEEPSKRLRAKLRGMWEHIVVVFNDEVGAAAPALYGTLSARAAWGRAEAFPDNLQKPFGGPLLHVDSGDFAQLRPVPRGSPSLMEGILPRQLGENRSRKLTDLEEHGLQLFNSVAQNTVEFRGTYRFRKGDPLILLLNIMRTVGGAPVPPDLREKVLSQQPMDNVSSFSMGLFSCVNWEQAPKFRL